MVNIPTTYGNMVMTGGWFMTLLYPHYLDWRYLPYVKAYFLGLCKETSRQNMARNMVQCLHFGILKFPLMGSLCHGKSIYGGFLGGERSSYKDCSFRGILFTILFHPQYPNSWMVYRKSNGQKWDDFSGYA